MVNAVEKKIISVGKDNKECWDGRCRYMALDVKKGLTSQIASEQRS